MTFVLSVGEALLRLSPPPGVPLEDANDVRLDVGGAELNVAAALAQLGTPSGFCSWLPDNALGRRVLRTLRAFGVDTREVRCTPDGRLGTYYLEQYDAPRGSAVTYDRAHSSFARMPANAFEDVNVETMTHLHMSGISLAVSDDAATAAQGLLERAAVRGVHVSFDVNHRAALPAAPRAAERYWRALQHASVVFAAERDVPLLLRADVPHGPDALALHAHLPRALIVVTRGARGSSVVTPAGRLFEHPAIPAGGPGRVGRGDAFAAGFLHAWLRTNDAEEAQRWATAAAALKMTTPGDQLRAGPHDVPTVLARSAAPALEDIQR